LEGAMKACFVVVLWLGVGVGVGAIL